MKEIDLDSTDIEALYRYKTEVSSSSSRKRVKHGIGDPVLAPRELRHGRICWAKFRGSEERVQVIFVQRPWVMKVVRFEDYLQTRHQNRGINDWAHVS